MSGLKRSKLGVSVGVAASLCIGSWTGRSLAQSESGVQACARAYEEAQVQRNGGQLKAAQERLKICVQDQCPDFVRADCNQWLQEVNAALPTVTFAAVDATGADLFEVKVSVDGVVVAESLDGRAIELDPGQHALVFEYQGTKIEQKLLVRQGEKNRVVRAQIQTEQDSDGDGLLNSADKCPNEVGDKGNQGCPASVPPDDDPPTTRTKGGMSPLLLGTYISGGVAAASFITAGVFYFLEEAEAEEAQDECRNGGCSPERQKELLESNQAKADVQTAGLIVGGVGLVTGGVLFYLWLEEQKSTSSAPAEDVTGLNFDVTAGPEGGFLQMRGAF